MKKTFLILVVAIIISGVVDIPQMVDDVRPVAASSGEAVVAQVADNGISDIINWAELAETASTSMVLLALVWLLWRRHIQQQTTIEEGQREAQAKYDQLVQLLLTAYLGKPVSPVGQLTGMEEFLQRPLE